MSFYAHLISQSRSSIWDRWFMRSPLLPIVSGVATYLVFVWVANMLLLWHLSSKVPTNVTYRGQLATITEIGPRERVYHIQLENGETLVVPGSQLEER